MGRASANGLRGLAIAAVAALLIAVLVGAADGKKKRAAAASCRADHAAAPGGRRRCDQREGQGQGRPSRRRRRPGHRLRPAHLAEEGQARQAHRQRAPLGRGQERHGRLLGHRAQGQVRQGRGQEEGQEERARLARHPSIAMRRSAASDRRTRPRARTTARRSTPRTRPLRLHGSHGLPAAVAERLLHQGRTRRTDTGRRLTSTPSSTPANIHGVHIDTTDINRADGFSPGNLITLKIPQVETQAAFDNTGFVPVNDLHSYADAEPAGRRDRRGDGRAAADLRRARREPEPLFAGRHQGRQPDHPARPATSTEGHRYIVALRGLRDAQNNPVDPPMPFRVYSDRLITSGPGDREPPSPHGGPDLDAPAGRDPAVEPVHGLGLHGRERAQPRRPGPGDPRQRATSAG